MSRRYRDVFTYRALWWGRTEINVRRNIKPIIAHGGYRLRDAESWGPVALPFKHRRRRW